MSEEERLDRAEITATDSSGTEKVRIRISLGDDA
jgi:hypothetical protein